MRGVHQLQEKPIFRDVEDEDRFRTVSCGCKVATFSAVVLTVLVRDGDGPGIIVGQDRAH